MAQTPEKKVKDKVVKILKELDVYYFFPATHGFGRSGVPDIVCCHKGNFIAFECKAGGNKTTALQDREIQAIHKAGGAAVVITENNIDLVRAVLSSIDFFRGNLK